MTDSTIEAATNHAGRYGGVDGAHHKQWVIDQMLRVLLGAEYDAWVRVYNNCIDANGETYRPWDIGIAP